MTSTGTDAFAADPFADHSARFPLGRVPTTNDTTPSPAATRPWGLRGMHTARQQGDPVREAFHYDHERQVAVGADGGLLLPSAATAKSHTSGDGDEGPSEDWEYDFAPDSPYSV